MNTVGFRESMSVGSEIIQQLLEGKSSDEILSNIDLNDEYLGRIALAMQSLSEAKQINILLVPDANGFSEDNNLRCVLGDPEAVYAPTMSL